MAAGAPSYNIEIISAPAYRVVIAFDIDATGSDRDRGRAGQGLQFPQFPGRWGLQQDRWHRVCPGQRIKMWRPPGQTKHGGSLYAQKKGGGVGVADWRERMKTEQGKTDEALYRLRAQHDCTTPRPATWVCGSCRSVCRVKARI
ncbi:Putative transposase (fragment) [Bradyrhizobium sp. ORS 285]